MRVGGLESVITPVFQPIVHLDSGRPLYFEALARATAAKGHRELLAFAEGYGFIQLIDAAMLQAAARVLVRHPTVSIGVNISVATIERFCGQLVSGIYEHLDVASRLVVEVTETMPIQNVDRLRTFIGAARSAGVRIAFDDYGDGHFTLDHVRRFEPDIVKIGEGLIADRECRRSELELLLSAAAQHGITVVAEALDTEEKVGDCASRGIAYGQGYLLGQIVSEDDVAQAEAGWQEVPRLRVAQQGPRRDVALMMRGRT